MSISGVGNAGSYIYQNVVERNKRKNGGTLFNQSGMSTASNLRDVSGKNGRFSINDAFNSMMANGKFRSEIGERYLQNVNDRNFSLWAQSKDEIQKVDVQQQFDKIQELADLYKEKYPNLVKSDDLARGLALEEIAGVTVRTENGFITVACNGIQYMDNNDQSKGWGFMFSENDTDIYSQIMQAITEGTIKGGMESVSGWEEWFKEKGYSYERP